MFTARIQRIIDLSRDDNCVLFTISRGAHLSTHIGARIMEILMRKERQLQGAGEQERITPQGHSIEISDISTELGFQSGINFAEVHAASKPIVRFAAANQMRFVGLFKDLSPTFAKIYQSF